MFYDRFITWWWNGSCFGFPIRNKKWNSFLAFLDVEYEVSPGSTGKVMKVDNLRYISICRSYPQGEFVVASRLAATI